MKLTACPKCESASLGDQWVRGRRLQQYCHSCDWRGEDRVPEQLEIKTKKVVAVGRFYGFEYEVFDRFGHLSISSRTYATETEAVQQLKRDLERGKKDEQAGPYTAVLWPAQVEVEGEVFDE